MINTSEPISLGVEHGVRPLLVSVRFIKRLKDASLGAHSWERAA